MLIFQLLSVAVFKIVLTVPLVSTRPNFDFNFFFCLPVFKNLQCTSFGYVWNCFFRLPRRVPPRHAPPVQTGLGCDLCYTFETSCLRCRAQPQKPRQGLFPRAPAARKSLRSEALVSPRCSIVSPEEFVRSQFFWAVNWESHSQLGKLTLCKFLLLGSPFPETLFILIWVQWHNFSLWIFWTSRTGLKTRYIAHSLKLKCEI